MLDIFVNEKTVEELKMEHPSYTYIKTDRNGTRWFADPTCGRCGGSGRVPYRVDNGVCWECGGSGRSKSRTVKFYTPVYRAKLDEANRKRNAAKLEAKKEAFKKNLPSMLEKWGFSKEDETMVIYRVQGDTYSIKDALKALGCHFNQSVGWYSATPLNDYPCQRMTAEDVLILTDISWDWKIKSDIKFVEPATENSSVWVGEIGDKIEKMFTVVRRIDTQVQAGYNRVGSSIFIMEDEDKNVYKWSTQKWFEVNQTYKLKGTIKDHCEYNGVKQTVVTRMKEVM